MAKLKPAPKKAAEVAPKISEIIREAKSSVIFNPIAPVAPKAEETKVETKTAEVKEAPKAETKAAAKTETKAEEKAAPKAEKKPRATRTTKTAAAKAAPAPVAEEVVVQYSVMEWKAQDLFARAKEIFVEAGNRASAVKDVTLYIKPEERKAYFVINKGEGEFTGAINL